MTRQDRIRRLIEQAAPQTSEPPKAESIPPRAAVSAPMGFVEPPADHVAADHCPQCTQRVWTTTEDCPACGTSLTKARARRQAAALKAQSSTRYAWALGCIIAAVIAGPKLMDWFGLFGVVATLGALLIGMLHGKVGERHERLARQIAWENRV